MANYTNGIRTDALDWSNPFSMGPESSGSLGFKGMVNTGMFNAPITALAGGVGNAIAGGKTSGAGNVISGLGDIASMVPGPWGAALGAGLKFAGAGVNALFGSKLNDANIAQLKGDIARANNVTASASTFDTLSSIMSSSADVGNFSDSFIGSDGVFSNTAGNLAKKLRAKAELADARQARTFRDNAENISEDTMSNLIMNSFDKGGKIYIKPSRRGTFTTIAKRHGMGVQEFASKVLANKDDYSPSTVKKANFARNASKWKHAFGGSLMTHGSNFDTGLLYIGNGGSHEDNPYEGVPMGVDPNGIPNLVEEGETIYNDYVFSKRLKVPKAIRTKYKLRDGITFADASKKMAKESEERPNDPISKAGLEALLSDLSNAQEELKTNNGMNKFSNGGKVNKFDGKSTASNKLNTYKNFTKLSKDTDFYTDEYLDFWEYMNDPKNAVEAQKWVDRINSGAFGEIGGNTFSIADTQKLSRDFKKGPVHKAYAEAARQFALNNPKAIDITGRTPETNPLMGGPSEVTGRTWTGIDTEDYNPIEPSFGFKGKDTIKDIEVPNTPIQAPTQNTGSDTGSGDNQLGMLPTWMRYAPAIGYGSMALTDALGITNKPDYTDANRVLNEARSITYDPVRWSPVGNKLTYRPLDRDYYTNKLNAESSATRRAVLQNAGLNRGMGMAALLASDYNAQGQLGQLARQAEEYNFAQRQKVEDFNRSTNLSNSQGALQADMANQRSGMTARELAFKGIMSGSEMRTRERMATDAARSQNLSGFLQSLGDIGRENVAWNWRNDLASRNVFGIYASKGGKISRRKKGLTF